MRRDAQQHFANTCIILEHENYIEQILDCMFIFQENYKSIIHTLGVESMSS
jgi:hypothetical protein